MFQRTYVEKTITAGSPVSGWGDISVTDNVDLYHVSTSGLVTLSDDWVLAPTGTKVQNMILRFWWDCSILLNKHTITVCGYVMSQGEVNSKNIIECRWDGTAWSVIVYVNYSDTDLGVSGTEIQTLTSTGGYINLDTRKNAKYIIFKGLDTLNTNYIIRQDPTSTAKDGDEFWLKYEATMTLNGYAITLFGVILTIGQALAGNTTIFCKYSGVDALWHITVFDTSSGTSGNTCSGRKSVVVTGTVITFPYSMGTNVNGEDYTLSLKGWDTDGSSVVVGFTARTNNGFTAMPAADCILEWDANLI